jgi:hypothetical protein
MTDSKERLSFMNWYICAVHTAARKPTLRITGDGLQKIPCQSMEYYYMMFRFVCGYVKREIRIMGPIFYEDHKFTHQYVIQRCPILQNP